MAEYDPEASIEELYRRDPLELTDTDLETICAELRKSRKEFQKKENAKASGGGGKKSGGEQLTLDQLKLS